MNHLDVIQRIIAYNRDRDPERLALKYKAMRKDALAFFRGTCHLFAEDWPPKDRVNDAPDVWVCGDLHLENFGSYKGDNRLVYFDIADFDEALLAPCTWDLTRLLTSFLIAAKVHSLKRKPTLALCTLCLDAYTLALRDGKARWIERATARGPIRTLLEGLGRRTQMAFIKKRTTIKAGRRRLCIDGKHTLPIDYDDRNRMKGFMRKFAQSRAAPTFFKMLDVARRIAGTGSLGLPRYTVLVNGFGTPAEHFLLDLKFAPPSSLAKYVRTKQPKWGNEADRVVGVERRMQAVAPALLQAVAIDSAPFVLRELMPSQDKLDLQRWKGELPPLESLVRDLGSLVAWSELRSSGRNGSATIDELIKFGTKHKWRNAVLACAEEYQGIAERDWEQFREAYDDGALHGS